MIWQFAQPWSIKARVTLATLTIFAISIWSLAFYASRMLREDIQRLVGEQQLSTAAFVAAEVNQGFAERFSALEIGASGITPSIFGNTAALQTLIEQSPVLEHLFNRGVTVADANGTVIADAPVSEGRIGVNYMDRDYMMAALKEGKATIGRPVMGKVSKAPVIVMAVPIRNPPNKVIGVLSGVVDLGKPSFLDKINESNYGKSGNYLLVDPKDRLIVASSDKRRIMEQLPAPGVLPSLDRNIQGFEGSEVIVTALGVEVLSSIKRVPVVGWYVAVTLPTAEAFTPVSDMQQRMLIATILLSLLAGGLTWWILRHQLAPMIATVKTLATLSDSTETPQQLPIKRQDEIGALIGGFNRLLERLAQREKELLESGVRSRAFYDCVNDAIFVHDAETGEILDVNGRMCEMYGYTYDEALRLDVGALSSGESPYSQKEALALVHKAAAGEPQLFQWCARQRDGHLFWVEVNMRCATVEGRDRIIVTVRDISERHRLEAQLRERTEELALEAQRKDLFLAMLGHELRNPLAPIRTAAQILRRSAPGDGRIERVSMIIERQVQQLTRLIDDLLDLSRIAEGKILLRKERVDMVGLLKAVADDIRPILESAGLSFQAHLPDLPVWVEGDSARLAQIVGNLLQNARKFTDPGGSIALNLRVDPEAAEANIFVSDTGIGIDRGHLTSIFVPFRQIASAPERNRGGLGLGLALVKNLVELHGGRVEARSAGPGRGAEFLVTLPLGLAAAERPAASADVPVDHGSRRVLIVEDNVDAAATLRMLMQSTGHEAREAHDAAAGLELARQWSPDVIVCDITMPGSMDGCGLARTLRRDAALRGTYLIALSGHGNEEDKRRTQEAGFDAHIIKPADPVALERLVASAPALRGKSLS